MLGPMTPCRPLVAALALAAAAVLAPRPAEAACIAPPADLVWSYPAEGEVGVPTNAVLRFVVTGTITEVRAGDRVVAEGDSLDGRLGIDPGVLDPDADHRVEVVVQGWDMQSEPAVFALEFRTGSGPRDETFEAPVLQGTRRVSDTSHLSETCNAVLRAQGCYDVDPLELHRLDVAGHAVAWLVEADGGPPESRPRGNLLWPAECGQPTYIVSGGGSACFRVQAFDESGNQLTSNTRCKRGGLVGCAAVAGGTASVAVFLAIAGLGLGAAARRRRGDESTGVVARTT
jgi:hypothetical protein